MTVTRAETCIRRWRCEQRRDPGDDALVTAPPAEEGPQPVVHRADPVHADRDREPVRLEEVAVVGGQPGAVGGDREA